MHLSEHSTNPLASAKLPSDPQSENLTGSPEFHLLHSGLTASDIEYIRRTIPSLQVKVLALEANPNQKISTQTLKREIDKLLKAFSLPVVIKVYGRVFIFDETENPQKNLSQAIGLSNLEQIDSLFSNLLKPGEEIKNARTAFKLLPNYFQEWILDRVQSKDFLPSKVEIIKIAIDAFRFSIYFTSHVEMNNFFNRIRDRNLKESDPPIKALLTPRIGTSINLASIYLETNYKR